MAEDRLFVSLRSALRGIFSKTAEQAEEAMMETDAVPVTTEPLSLNNTGAASPGEAVASSVPDQGTSVDTLSSGESTASGAESAGGPNPSDFNAETTNAVIKKDEAVNEKVDANVKNEGGSADGTIKSGISDSADTETKVSEGHVKAVEEESIQANELNAENVQSENNEIVEEEINFDKKEGWSNIETAVSGSKDRLEKLSQQIDDFDDVLESSRPSSLPVNKEKDLIEPSDLVGDLTDKIIDELIEEASNVSEIDSPKQACTGAEGTERQISSGDDDTEGAVTPDNELSDDSPTESKDLQTGSLSAETDMNDAESRVNGKDTEECMTASTESDGFADDKPAVDKPEQTAETDTTANQTGDKKSEKDKKAETSSPTKTAKSKKKEDKSIEHILKALSSLQSTEEKLAALCKKYADLHEDHRVLQTSFKQSQRKLAVMSREKDQLQTEHTKAVMAKSKLESLCRELQKHNQTIRQESLQRAKEEDEKRKEISQKFQTTIGEIQQQMQENHDRNKQLREENFELANKLKKFIEQYEAREKQVEKVIQHRDLEQKLADAKLEQASAILMEEKTRSQKDREVLLLQTADNMKKIQLKDAELKMYKERYEEFQSTIKRSEEMFNKFKTEMDKMTKRCRKLDKETVQWKGKWESANRALLDMAEEKQRYDKEKTLLMTKISKLESLCRAMQAERKARKMLESEGVDLSKLNLDDDTPSLYDPPFPSDAPDSTSDSAPTPSPASQSPTHHQPTPEPVSKSSIEDIDEDEDDSDLSSASEITGVTVIEPDSQQAQPPDTSQSVSTPDGENQSKEEEVPGQSESGTDQPSQSESNQTETAS